MPTRTHEVARLHTTYAEGADQIVRTAVASSAIWQFAEHHNFRTSNAGLMETRFVGSDFDPHGFGPSPSYSKWISTKTVPFPVHIRRQRNNGNALNWFITTGAKRACWEFRMVKGSHKTKVLVVIVVLDGAFWAGSFEFLPPTPAQRPSTRSPTGRHPSTSWSFRGRSSPLAQRFHELESH